MSLIRKVAIIGGGPAGLAAAKALMLEPVKFSIDLYDRRDKLGGLWYYSSDKTQVHPPIPSVDPNGVETGEGASFEHKYVSAMYNHLETNLIDRMMEYKDVPFEPRSLAFITRSEVHDYLLKYASTIPNGVNYRLGTNVLDVWKQDQTWTVKSETSGSSSSETYDAVVVANGHTNVPYIPDTPGLAHWNESAPGSISHARYYKDATDYQDKTVLIIGNYASGIDLATQIGTTAKQVYVGTKGESQLIEVDQPNVEYLKLVTGYDFDNNRSISTEDGRVVSNIDHIIFCTGYLYSLPFLQNYLPNITDGGYVRDVYKQIFNVDDPTLSFIELPKFVVPMPLSESQSAVVARVYSGRLKLPSREERRAEYEQELREKGEGKSFHAMKPPLDYTYCNELYDWIKSEKLDETGLVPIYWGKDKIYDREVAKDIKDERYLAVVEHAKKLRERGQAFFLPEKAPAVNY